MYIVCDMNCNNMGNYFSIVGKETELAQDKHDWITNGNTYWPKAWCFRARLHMDDIDKGAIKYSEAINTLYPDDFRKWNMRRFAIGKGKKI